MSAAITGSKTPEALGEVTTDELKDTPPLTGRVGAAEPPAEAEMGVL